MVLVKMPDGRDWFKANWVFRQLVHDVGRYAPSDREIQECFDQAQAFGSLDLGSISLPLRGRVIGTMIQAIEATNRGELPGWRRQDPDGRAMYLEALDELAALLTDESAVEQ